MFKSYNRAISMFRPSFVPQKMYCDLMGLDGKYRNPKTMLKFIIRRINWLFGPWGLRLIGRHVNVDSASDGFRVGGVRMLYRNGIILAQGWFKGITMVIEAQTDFLYFTSHGERECG